MLYNEITTVYFEMMRKLINSMCMPSEECLKVKTGGAYLSIHTYICIHRVIHKSLRDFQPLRYSNRDGHAQGEHVNRERETLQVSVLPYRCSIRPPLVTRQISIL